VETLLLECKRNAERLAAAIVKARGLVADTLQRQADEIDAQYRKLASERDRLRGELEGARFSQAGVDKKIALRDNVLQGLAKPSFEKMMMVFDALDLQVVAIGEGKIRIACALPIEERVIEFTTQSNEGRAEKINPPIRTEFT
jgi:hypothetical protein